MIDSRRLAVTAGDDASPDAVYAALEVLRALDPPAVDATIAAGDRLTPDVGGSASTTEFAGAVREQL